jgi:small-conductance mechanosensitive channel
MKIELLITICTLFVAIVPAIVYVVSGHNTARQSRKDIADLSQRTADQFAALRADMKEGFAAAHQETADLRAEMKEGFAAAHQETADLSQKTGEQFTELRTDMNEHFNRIEDRLADDESKLSMVAENVEHIKGNLEGETRTCHTMTLMLEAQRQRRFR